MLILAKDSGKQFTTGGSSVHIGGGESPIHRPLQGPSLFDVIYNKRRNTVRNNEQLLQTDSGFRFPFMLFNIVKRNQRY